MKKRVQATLGAAAASAIMCAMTVVPASADVGSPAITTVTPARILDSRRDKPTIDGKFALGARLTAESVVAVQVADRAGVPADASGVMLNVTAIRPAKAGFVTVFPCGSPRPDASNVNFVANDVRPNLVFAQIGSAASVCVYTSADTDLAIDVNAYIPKGASLTPVVPARAADTRRSDPGSRMGPGSTTRVVIAGRFGVPVGATAAFVNVTSVRPAGPGYLTVFPCGPTPNASSVNYGGKDVNANLVFAQLDSAGALCISTLAETDVLVDVNGFMTGTSGATPTDPFRVTDTRPGGTVVAGGLTGTGPLPAGATLRVPVGGLGPVQQTSGAVLVNVTAIRPAADGFLTVYPCGSAVPIVSNVNYRAGSIIPNSVVAPVVDGLVCIFTSATTDIAVDVNGAIPSSSGSTPSTAPPNVVDTTTTTSAATTSTSTPISTTTTTVSVPVTSVVNPGSGTLELISCNSASEEVVIANNSSVTFQPTGWVLHDEGPQRSVDLGSIIPSFEAGTRLTVVSGTDRVPGPGEVLGWDNFVWNNSGDTAYLVAPDGSVTSMACS